MDFTCIKVFSFFFYIIAIVAWHIGNATVIWISGTIRCQALWQVAWIKAFARVMCHAMLRSRTAREARQTRAAHTWSRILISAASGSNGYLASLRLINVNFTVIEIMFSSSSPLSATYLYIVMYEQHIPFHGKAELRAI